MIIQQHFAHVFENVYVGNWLAPKNDFFADSYIINASISCPIFDHVRTIRVPIADDMSAHSGYQFDTQIAKAISFLVECRRLGRKVLVHCFAGQQRSCAIIVSYLIYRGHSIDEAIALIQSKNSRSFAFGTNVHFLESIYRFKHAAPVRVERKRNSRNLPKAVL